MSELVKVPYRTVHTLLLAGMRRVLTFQAPEMKLWATMALELCVIEEKLLGTLDAEHAKRLETRGWALLIDGVPYATNRYVRLLRKLEAFKEGDAWTFIAWPGDAELCLIPQEELERLASQVEALSVEVNA
jgi:hypothetical protein